MAVELLFHRYYGIKFPPAIFKIPKILIKAAVVLHTCLKTRGQKDRCVYSWNSRCSEYMLGERFSIRHQDANWGSNLIPWHGFDPSPLPIPSYRLIHAYIGGPLGCRERGSSSVCLLLLLFDLAERAYSRN